jgi:hypothetical protein
MADVFSAQVRLLTVAGALLSHRIPRDCDPPRQTVGKLLGHVHAVHRQAHPIRTMASRTPKWWSSAPRHTFPRLGVDAMAMSLRD